MVRETMWFPQCHKGNKQQKSLLSTSSVHHVSSLSLWSLGSILVTKGRKPVTLVWIVTLELDFPFYIWLADQIRTKGKKQEGMSFTILNYVIIYFLVNVKFCINCLVLSRCHYNAQTTCKLTAYYWAQRKQGLCLLIKTRNHAPLHFQWSHDLTAFLFYGLIFLLWCSAYLSWNFALDWRLSGKVLLYSYVHPDEASVLIFISDMWPHVLYNSEMHPNGADRRGPAHSDMCLVTMSCFLLSSKTRPSTITPMIPILLAYS